VSAVAERKDFDWLPLAAVKPWAKNPRKNKVAIAPVAGSIRRFGFVAPVVIWLEGDRMVAGHTRLLALESLLKADPRFTPPGAPGPGLVPVRFQRFGSDAEATAYALADNRLGELAAWDEDALPEILRGIQAQDEALLDTLGWPAGHIEKLLRHGLETQPEGDVPIERAAELQEKWKTALGQLWEIPSRGSSGAHRILCGDSTSTADVARLMDGQQAVLMCTDPPYGVDYAAMVASRKNQKKGGWPDINNDALSDEDLLRLLTGALDGRGATVAFVWHPANLRRRLFWEALQANGWTIAQEIVWVKNALVFGCSDYQWRHEPCLYAKRPGARPQADRTQTSVWEVPKPTDSEHPTQKPLPLFEIPIRNHTQPGEVCFDPFLGSGTTVVAAERERRIGFGIELSPGYVAVALERLAVLGLEPRLL
jgi:DNA modification methylase